ncbi:MAG: ferredoxin [Pseudomonadota bacterium]
MTHRPPVLDDISRAASAHGLSVVGAFHPDLPDMAPEGTRTLVMLGPGDTGMWQIFAGSPEYLDGAEHPLDRWSHRVVTALATELSAMPLFPFGGPPWHPFQRWAERAEGAVSSPVRMQATAARGLWTSYRGALAFRDRIDLPPPASANPCLACAAPCMQTCPVGAFSGDAYDVPRCTAHVQSDAGTACLTGCLVRRSCPAGTALDLPEEQQAFHMAAFLRSQG